MKKLCLDCKERKPVDAFYRLRKGEEARQSRCKTCDNRKRAGNVRRSDVVVDAVRHEDGSIELVRHPRRAS